jgi:hypothetical protein
MRFAPVLLALALVASCGKEPSKPPPKPPTPPAPVKPAEPALKSDPNGKNLCLACNFRTNDAACPKCKTVLKAAMEEKPKTSAPTGEVGKSAVSAVYACPKEGCKFTDARKGKCLPHPDVDLKEQWFVCDKCSVKEPLAGKCSKCQADLARKLQ